VDAEESVDRDLVAKIMSIRWRSVHSLVTEFRHLTLSDDVNEC